MERPIRFESLRPSVDERLTQMLLQEAHERYKQLLIQQADERYTMLQMQQLDDDGSPVSLDNFSHYPSEVYYDPNDRVIVTLEPQLEYKRNWIVALLSKAASAFFLY